jgi:lipoprotein-anchoring transpeptidase ErfK/SrfK
MEPRFGHDFSKVRVHTGDRAAASTDAVGANTYAVGSHIVLPTPPALPGVAGRRLLAHELAHVVQQDEREPPASGLTVAAPSSVPEAVAAKAAHAEGAGVRATLSPVGGPTLLFRDEKGAAATKTERIVVDLGNLTATAFEGDTKVRRMPISSGKPGFATPTGDFTIQEGDRDHRSSTYGKCVSAKGSRTISRKSQTCKKGEKYEGAPMSYYKPFYPATGFHEGKTSVPSHGCIHLEQDDAKWLWDWAGTGTPVHITGSKSGGSKAKGTKTKKKAPAKKKTSALEVPPGEAVAVNPVDGADATELVGELADETDELGAEEFESWWGDDEVAVV